MRLCTNTRAYALGCGLFVSTRCGKARRKISRNLMLMPHARNLSRGCIGLLHMDYDTHIRAPLRYTNLSLRHLLEGSFFGSALRSVTVCCSGQLKLLALGWRGPFARGYPADVGTRVHVTNRTAFAQMLSGCTGSRTTCEVHGLRQPPSRSAQGFGGPPVGRRRRCPRSPQSQRAPRP